MKKSIEVQHMENSIASLVSSLADVIRAELQASVNRQVSASPEMRVDSGCKNQLSPSFTDFDGLLKIVPLGARTVRERIKRGQIPSILLPGGRRRLFHIASVEKAMLRFQTGGIE